MVRYSWSVGHLSWARCWVAYLRPLGSLSIFRPALSPLGITCQANPTLGSSFLLLGNSFHKSLHNFRALLLLFPLLIASFLNLMNTLKLIYLQDLGNFLEILFKNFFQLLFFQIKFLGCCYCCLQLMYSANFLRINTGSFHQCDSNHLTFFLLLNIPKWLKPPEECLSKLQVKALLVCLLEWVELFIHSLSHKVKWSVMHIFVGIGKHFLGFYVRSFCKWEQPTEVPL